MEDTYAITGDQLECLVCCEIPIKVHETECWGTIIWETWGPKLKTCPNRCLAEGAKLILNVNKFVQRMINGIKVKWEFWEEEFPRSKILEHKEVWDKNKLKNVIFNPALHPCFLHRTDKTNSWYWDGLKIMKHGWASSGTEKIVHTKGESWYWSRWDVDYWSKCIETYGDNSDESDLKSFPKEGIMHLSHPHPLTLYFGTNLPEAGRRNWYGRYKKNACTGDGSEKIRYLVWFDWKLVLWEKCYLSPHDDFIIRDPKLHKCPLHIQAIPTSFSWGCDLKKDDCLKKDHQVNKQTRISYRCDLCDFDACFSCIGDNK